MGPDALLKPACELSYAVARDGVEADPLVSPPAAMRSFLYVSQLPGRAITVAREVIEEDPGFRRRVAERADEGDIGRAGYLWLHRPEGWAAEFEEIVNNNGVTENDSGRREDLDVVPAMPPLADHDDGRAAGSGSSPASGSALGSYDGLANGGPPLGLSLGSKATGRSEANAIEDELSSLRGLVERLSNERKSVSSSVRRIEQEIETARHQPSMFDADIYTLQSELETSRAELDQARIERDNAVRQQSEALTRRLELEKELARARDLRAEIEQEHAEADARLVEVRESLARAEAAASTLQEKREELESQLTVARLDHEQLQTQMNRATEEHHSRYHALETSHHAVVAEVESLRADEKEASAKAASLETELAEVRAALTRTEAQATETQALVDALTEEKIDLASRLADTEAMLETTRTQINAVKSDAQAISADLANVRAHRDGLSTQVDELHAGLTEALNDLATVRSSSDADRAGLKEVRAERDQLRVRVTSLEQSEATLESKLTAATTERDAATTRAEQAKAELAEREKSHGELSRERDRLTEELAASKSALQGLTAERDALDASGAESRVQISELAAERDSLSEQVEQLTEENSGIQEQLVESDRLRVENAESQGHALSELAHRLSVVETERNRFERELREAEDRLIEAMTAFDAANQAAAEQVRDQLGTAGSVIDSSSRTPSTSGSKKTDSSSSSKVSKPSKAKAGSKGSKDSGSEPAAGKTKPGEAANGLVDVTSTFPLGSTPADVIATNGVGLDKPGKQAKGTDDTGPSSIPPSVLDSADAPPPPVAGGDRAGGDNRSSKRWNFGPLVKGGTTGDDDRDDAADETATAPAPADEAKPVPSLDQVLTDVTAPVVVDTTGDDTGPVAISPSDLPAVDDDIDDVGTELAQAMGAPAVEAEPDQESADDVDLDAISDLISQTVTDFDPDSIPEGGFEDEVFEEEPDEPVDDGTKAEPFEVMGKGRAASGAPPSVFADVVDDELPLGRVVPPGTGELQAVLDGGSRREPKGARRRIDIPMDLMDDEVEVARHVVSSPDVVLLVDGDSVAKMGWPSLPVAQQRDALVSYLADLSTSTGAAPDVVFDGRIGEEESLPASRSVRIRLSTPPTEPTAALDELVDAYPEQWPIAVVTDDEELSKSANERGAAVLNNGQLLDLFISQ